MSTHLVPPALRKAARQTILLDKRELTEEYSRYKHTTCSKETSSQLSDTKPQETTCHYSWCS